MAKIIKFVRKDDGEEFTLNDDGMTYSLEFMKGHYPGALHRKWTAKELSTDDFTAIAGP